MTLNELETDEHQCPECDRYLKRATGSVTMWVCDAHMPLRFFRIDFNGNVVDFRINKPDSRNRR